MPNIVRLLLLGFAIWFGYRMWKSWQRQAQLRQKQNPEAFEPTVQCGRCGVHMPVSAASPTGLCGKCSG